jgi:Flp pilus assembly protein TadG
MGRPRQQKGDHVHGTGPHGQDGFIREILWLFLAIAVVAALLLDGMAIFGTHQSIADDTATAARAARTEYAQTLSVPLAKIAAQKYLGQSDAKMVSFTVGRDINGNPRFTVEAKAHAKTYVFKYLRYVGLKRWVARVTNPTATSRSQ